MLTGYDNGCKQGLQLKNSLKFHFEKQIVRNLQGKNAYGGFGGLTSGTIIMLRWLF